MLSPSPSKPGLTPPELSQQQLKVAMALKGSQVVLDRIKQDALWWLRNATKTFNPHWQEQGFDSPYAAFPDDEYLDLLFDYFQPKNKQKIDWVRSQMPDDPKRGARLRVIEKSRTMLGTWSCVGYCTHDAQTVAGHEWLFQSQTKEKAEELVDYAKILWDMQDEYVKLEFPLDRKLSDFPMNLLRWKNGSRIVGIPSDPDKVRMFHPTGMLIDEAAFLSEFKRNLETALPACSTIIALSSAGPSEFGDWVNQ